MFIISNSLISELKSLISLIFNILRDIIWRDSKKAAFNKRFFRILFYLSLSSARGGGGRIWVYVIFVAEIKWFRFDRKRNKVSFDTIFFYYSANTLRNNLKTFYRVSLFNNILSKLEFFYVKQISKRKQFSGSRVSQKRYH